MLAWLTWFWINFVMTTALICDIWLCHIRIFLWLDSMPCIWDVWLSLALTWLHGSVNCFIAKALTLNREFNFFYLMTSAILNFLHCSSGYCSNCTHARFYSKCCLLCCISLYMLLLLVTELFVVDIVGCHLHVLDLWLLIHLSAFGLIACGSVLAIICFSADSCISLVIDHLDVFLIW